VEQGEEMPTNEIFTVGESATLLHAIFPRYPDLRGMKPAPEVGVFLLDLRSQGLSIREPERIISANDHP
jgi:hypothetical protein